MPLLKLFVSLIKAFLDLYPLFSEILLRRLPENVDHRVEPHHVGETARQEPKPGVNGRYVRNHVALEVLVVLMTRVLAVLNMVGPAIAHYRECHLVERNDKVELDYNPEISQLLVKMPVLALIVANLPLLFDLLHSILLNFLDESEENKNADELKNCGD
jgi:hypothetical protein